MISTTRMLVVVLILAGSGLLQHEAAARSPYLFAGGYGYGTGNGYYGFGNFFEMPYATDRIPTPPYFAIHPPVHYSHAVPRTYGYSPFAYPGTFATPEVATTEPLEVINPHVEQEEEEMPKAESAHHIAARPMIVRNPFVHQLDDGDYAELPTVYVAESPK